MEVIRSGVFPSRAPRRNIIRGARRRSLAPAAIKLNAGRGVKGMEELGCCVALHGLRAENPEASA